MGSLIFTRGSLNTLHASQMPRFSSGKVPEAVVPEGIRVYSERELSPWFGTRTRSGNFVWGYCKKQHKGWGVWSYLGYANYYTQHGISVSTPSSLFADSHASSNSSSSAGSSAPGIESVSGFSEPQLLVLQKLQLAVQEALKNPEVSSFALFITKSGEIQLHTFSDFGFLGAKNISHLSSLSPALASFLGISDHHSSSDFVAGHTSWGTWLRWIPESKTHAPTCTSTSKSGSASPVILLSFSPITSSKMEQCTSELVLQKIVLNAHLLALLAGQSHNAFADMHHYWGGDHTSHDFHTQFHFVIEEQAQIEHALHTWLAGVHTHSEFWIHAVNDDHLHFVGGSHHDWLAHTLEVYLWFHHAEASNHETGESNPQVHEGHGFSEWFLWWHHDMLHDSEWEGDHSFQRHAWLNNADAWWHYRFAHVGDAEVNHTSSVPHSESSADHPPHSTIGGVITETIHDSSSEATSHSNVLSIEDHVIKQNLAHSGWHASQTTPKPKVVSAANDADLPIAA